MVRFNISFFIIFIIYDPVQDSKESKELHEIVREGFELLGAFNWSDHLPWLNYFHNPFSVNDRCSRLVFQVRKLVQGIMKEHRCRESFKMSDNSDFVDVLLSLNGEEKLEEEDMVAILWVSIQIPL